LAINLHWRKYICYIHRIAFSFDLVHLLNKKQKQEPLFIYLPLLGYYFLVVLLLWRIILVSYWRWVITLACSFVSLNSGVSFFFIKSVPKFFAQCNSLTLPLLALLSFFSLSPLKFTHLSVFLVSLYPLLLLSPPPPPKKKERNPKDVILMSRYEKQLVRF